MLNNTIYGGGTTRPKNTDALLVAAFRAGDEDAFAKIVERYQHQLSGMCWRYLRDAHLVEDVVQEAFLRLFENRAQVDGAFNVSGWLHRIAVNLCLDELRGRARRGHLHPDLEDFEIPDRDRSARPDEAYEIALTRETMRGAAKQLPARQFAVLVLRDVMGKSQADTAAELGISGTAVQGILFRARERFRTEYVALARPGTEPVACATVRFTLESVTMCGLRRDRYAAVSRHLFSCPACWSRFGREVVVAGRLPDAARDARQIGAVEMPEMVPMLVAGLAGGN